MSAFRKAPRHLAALMAGALGGTVEEQASADRLHMQAGIACDRAH